MGCGPTKEEGLKDANSQDPNEAIDKTVEILEASLDTQHPILRRQRTWESIYDRKDEGKTPKSQKKSKVTYHYARTTFMIKPAVKKGGIPTWEVARESHQVLLLLLLCQCNEQPVQILGNQEAKVTELYSGKLTEGCGVVSWFLIQEYWREWSRERIARSTTCEPRAYIAS